MDYNIFEIIKVIFTVGNFVGLVGLFLFQRIAHEKLTTNDLKHIDADIKQISKKQEEQGKIQNEMRADIAYIKGSKEHETKVLEILTKVLEK